PGREDQNRRVHLLRDDIGIGEDAGADDAAHHDHGGVEEAEPAGERGIAGMQVAAYRFGHALIEPSKLALIIKLQDRRPSKTDPFGVASVKIPFACLFLCVNNALTLSEVDSR